MIVISYHCSYTGSPFYTAEAQLRYQYYSSPATPTVKIDGTTTLTGGEATGNMYPSYRVIATTRLGVASDLIIRMVCTYDSVANTGSVTDTIYNTSTSSISGTLHFAVIENNIPYNWSNLTTVEHVMRKMLPNASGEAVTIPASSSITRTQSFTINSAWNERNCRIATFVQASNRAIYQGAEIGILPIPKMEYYGYKFTELSGNINRIPQPGEQIRMYVNGKNDGDGIYSGTPSISCTDAYITINSSTPMSVALGPGDVDTVIRVDFTINPTCPVPRTSSFILNFGASSDTFPFMTADQAGFSDDIESGQGSWTHSGINDNWHITTHKSHSATNSWYCGSEGMWLYSNENDAFLVTPFFVATPDSSLKFWHTYALEVDYDYGIVEIDDGSGWWGTRDLFTGTQSTWSQRTYSLSSLAGQIIRLRFRFNSDPGTVDEGWYVDDVSVPIIVAVQENNAAGAAQALTITPNPFRTSLHINWNQDTRPLKLLVYDASGRLVRDLTPLVTTTGTSLTWNGAGESGQKLASGIYFIRITSSTNEQILKIMFLK